MKRGGSRGNSPAKASVTTSAKTFSEMRSQTLNRNRPPGRETRRASLYPWTLSGKNIAPNWHVDLVLERQGQGVGLPPCDAAIVQPGGGMVEHRLVEVGRHNARVRGKLRRHRTREDTG